MALTYVDYRCDHCGYTETPMNHRNPAKHCSGEFYQDGSGWRCDKCNSIYYRGTKFWCAKCQEWRTDYSVS